MIRGIRRAVVLVAASIAALFAPAAQAELAERGDLFVRFDGGISPNALPRTQRAPIAVEIVGTVRTLSGEQPPALRRIKIELNRGGHLDSRGLPACRYKEVVATSSSEARRLCGDSLVGGGSYIARSAFPEQDTFPSQGRILAFNGSAGGNDTILAHVYGADPLPATRIIVFHVRRRAGTFGTVLTGSLPASVNRYGYLAAIYLRLQRNYVYRGQRRSYLSAACAAPAGFPSAVFPFARASMAFADGRTLASTLTRSCQVSR